jgi:lipoyl(octanoyl) transferase
LESVAGCRIPGEGNLGPEMWALVVPDTMDYREAHDLQLRLVRARAEKTLTRDVFLLLEHRPVFTLGRRGGTANLLVPETFLKCQGIDVLHVERGGDITYHGPGQLVGYPIVDLRERGWGIAEYVTALEEVMIRTAGDWGVQAERSPLNRGVWAGKDKLGSIGIALRHWVSFHGFALNVNTDLRPFGWIHPCGLEGVSVTSMARLFGEKIPMADVRESLLVHMREVLRTRLVAIRPEDLRKVAPSITGEMEVGIDENRAGA